MCGAQAIGGASSCFVGTDVAYLGGEGNFLRPLVGIEDVDSDLLGICKAGTSTAMGFAVAQSIQNVSYKPGQAWLDPADPVATAQAPAAAAPEIAAPLRSRGRSAPAAAAPEPAIAIS